MYVLKATQTDRGGGHNSYCASDRIVKVSIDSYLGHQYCLKVILNNNSEDEIMWGMEIN